MVQFNVNNCVNYCVLQQHWKFAFSFRLWSGAVLKENIWGGALWCILKATECSILHLYGEIFGGKAEVWGQGHCALMIHF